MTTLEITFAEIYGEVARFLGLGSAPAGDDLALVKRFANDGYRLFLMGMDPRTQRAYPWSFLAPAASMTLAPGGGTDGAYALPEDFAAMVDDPVGGPAGEAFRIEPRSASYVRGLRAGGAACAGPAPRYYAVLPRPLVPAAGQRYELLVWPSPGATYTVRFRYRVEPPSLAEPGDRPLGGASHSATIMEAALAVAEQRHNDTRGLHTEQFERLLAASIDMDAAGRAPTLGGEAAGGAASAFERRGRVSYS
jgi:hypothetical protein